MVLDIAAWNYPLLIAVNVIVPALLAGERGAGQARPADAALRRPLRRRLRAHRGARRPRRGGDARPRRDRGADPVRRRWTTSRSPARSRAAARSTRQVAHRFIDAGLELGGKDPAYVCEDADFDFAVENVVDGAFYNAGQSCCGIERVYVARPLYDRFVDAAVALVRQYRMGDPEDPATTLGPARPAEGRRPGRAARGGGPGGRGPRPDRGHALAGPRLLLRADRPDRGRTTG